MRKEWVYEFASAIADQLNAANAIYNFEELVTAMDKATTGWHVSKSVVDLNHLHNPDESPAVQYSVDAKPRPLTHDEQEKRRKRREAFSWTVSHEGPPPAEVPTHELLAQKVYWRSRDGKVHEVRQMHPEHIRNLLQWMERNAGQLHVGYLGRFVSAPDDVQAEAFAEDPKRWLHEQPLFKALRKRLRKADEKYGREMREQERAEKATGK